MDSKKLDERRVSEVWAASEIESAEDKLVDLFAGKISDSTSRVYGVAHVPRLLSSVY
jgi:hypothetical protein